MFKSLACLSSAVLLSATANAADIVASPEPAPFVAAPAFSWTGFYAGGQAGWLKNKQSDQQKGEWGYGPLYFDGPFEKNSQKNDLFNGGVYAGYNFLVGEHWLIGADADITFFNSNSSNNEYYEDDFEKKLLRNGEIIEDNRQKVRFRHAAAARGRLGYIHGRTLFYLSGGVVTTKASIDISKRISFKSYDWGVLSEANFQASGSESATLNGGTVGAGIEYALSDHIIFRSEYRYSDFGSKEIKLKSSDFKENPSYKIDYKTHDLRFGVAYKF